MINAVAHRVIFSLIFLPILSGAGSGLLAQIPAEAADRYHDVLRCVNRGEAREAIRLGTILIREKPDLLRTYRLVATAFIKDSAVSEGRRFFDSLLALEPKRAGAHYGRSAILASGHDLAGAEKELKQCIELRPDFHDAYMRLANIPEASEHFDTIASWMQRRLAVDNKQGALHMGIGILRWRMRDLESGLQEFVRSLEIDSSAPIVYYHKGVVEQQMGRISDAQASFYRGCSVASIMHDLEYEAALTGLVGYTYDDLREPERATKQINKALILARSLADRRSEMFHTGALANSLRAQRRLEEALAAYDRALEMAVELQEIKYQEMTLGNKIAGLSDLERNEEAAVCGERALRMATARGDSIAVARYALNTGAAYANRAMYEAALNCFYRALDIYETAGMRSDALMTQANIGIALNSQGRNLETIETLERALRIARGSADKKSGMAACSAVGTAYGNIGMYDKADMYFRKALQSAFDINDAIMIVTQFGNIGLIAKKRGMLDTSIAYITRAIEDGGKYLDTRGVIANQNNLANVFQDRGDYSKALQLQEEALRLSEKIGAHNLTATILENIGTSYDKLGDPGIALNYYRRASHLALRIGAGKSIITSLKSIGIMYERLGRDSLSLEAYREAICLAREMGFRDVETFALMATGVVFMRMGDYPRALQHYVPAFGMYLEAGNLDGLGTLFVHIGEVMRDLHEFDASLDFLQKAESIARRLKDPIMAHDAQVRRGDIARRLKRYDEAIEWYEKSTRELESVRNTLRSESDRTSFLDRHSDAYELLVLAALDAGRTDDAYEYLQRFRAAGAREAAQAIRQSLRADMPPVELRGLHALEFRIRELYAQLGNGEVLSNTAMRGKAEHELQTSLDGHATLLASIERRRPRWSNATGAAGRLDIRAVQRMLPRGSILVEYFTNEESSDAWILRGDSVFFVELPLTSVELAEKITRLRRPFAEVREGKNLADVGFDVSLAGNLYKDIFAPLEKHLSPGAPLLIVPDGPLHFLPFELLVTEDARMRGEPGVLFSEYEGLRYLIEKYPISYLPGSGLLAVVMDSASGAGAMEGKLLGFGAPFLGTLKNAAAARADNTVSEISLRAGGKYRFRELASKDVAEVAAMMTPSDLHMGKDATEARLKERARHYPNLYISSHAVADERRPLYSFVVLAQDSAGREDGFLNAHEVFNLNLNADLVTLSACETGLGKLSRGEGVVGLTRAFLCAGARSLLMSLWSVDERSTRMMPVFYRNLTAGHSKVEALRMAKLELLRTRIGGISYAHPFLWAPFVLSGNPGAEGRAKE